MSRVVYRYTVPVDDQWHLVGMIGGLPPLHVAARRPDVVELWVEGRTAESAIPITTVELRVFGTGQPIPDGPRWLGTCLAADGALVWHLYVR